SPGPPGAAWPTDPAGRTIAADRLAAAAADRWEREHGAGTPRVFTPTGSYSDQIGTWEPCKGGYKAALINGCLKIPDGVLPATPGHAQIGWPDGTVQRRPIVPPSAIFEQRIPADARASCGDSRNPELTVTSAILVDAPIDTAWGPATVPMWQLSFADTAVRGSVLAVAADPTTAAPEPGQDIGPRPDRLTVSPDGRTLTVSFIGAPPGTGPCGYTYELRTAQRPGVVAVVVVATSTAPPQSLDGPLESTVGCPAVGALRTAATTLDTALGERPAIENRGHLITR
ncbi:hypothetical protein GT354_06520, partial [Streptomyces sp. SID3343]|nr:hypothetical protein [Streptomyces sp. SID3343]